MTWDLSGIEQLLSKREGWAVTNEGDCVCVTNEDGLDAFIAISGEQILVESVLFAKSQVSDVAAMNDEILKTHHIFPLTAVALSKIDDQEYYMAFGALSSRSAPETVMIEVELLFSNLPGFLEAYESFLNK